MRARCQLGNKAMKMKLTTMLKEQICKVKQRVDEDDFYTLKTKCKWKRTIGKTKEQMKKK